MDKLLKLLLDFINFVVDVILILFETLWSYILNFLSLIQIFVITNMPEDCYKSLNYDFSILYYTLECFGFIIFCIAFFLYYIKFLILKYGLLFLGLLYLLALGLVEIIFFVSYLVRFLAKIIINYFK